MSLARLFRAKNGRALRAKQEGTRQPMNREDAPLLTFGGRGVEGGNPPLPRHFPHSLARETFPGLRHVRQHRLMIWALGSRSETAAFLSACAVF
jgi:hypothetical protein